MIWAENNGLTVYGPWSTELKFSQIYVPRYSFFHVKTVFFRKTSIDGLTEPLFCDSEFRIFSRVRFLESKTISRTGLKRKYNLHRILEIILNLWEFPRI